MLSRCKGSVPCVPFSEPSPHHQGATQYGDCSGYHYNQLTEEVCAFWNPERKHRADLLSFKRYGHRSLAEHPHDHDDRYKK